MRLFFAVILPHELKCVHQTVPRDIGVCVSNSFCCLCSAAYV